MEIRVLRYFLEVAREENITKAAAFLHVSQPTLSRQLKELEDELGKKLFTRSNYSIKLTDEGMLLRKRAEEIIDMVDKTSAEFKSLDEITGGNIRIGCAESAGMKYFIQAAHSLEKKYPNIRFHFYSSGTDAVTERIDKGLIDMAVMVQKVDLSKFNYLTVPHSDCWGLLMRKDDPLSTRKSVTVNDLIHLPLICSRQGLQEELLDWFGEDFAKLHIAATYDMLFNTTIMARVGLGYPLGFDGLVNTGTDSDLCFRPLEPELRSPMHIIWKKHQVFTPVAKLLLEELKAMSG
ncbi:MAG: LysR family transcriptional regulator [Lachnospiraceae bacterium]|nr:LysR family transcriptional regulator [Lachnospiraceae bacterium]